ncbi:MAG: competence/damage-inducible protein A [Gemmatimonadota bacterium]
MTSSGPPSAALIIVGDEILSGEVQDRNTPFLTRRMWELGILVQRIVVVSDRLEEIAEEIRHQLSRSDFVVLTGGLGPTHDDVTRQAVAVALELPLEVHPDARDLLATDYGGRPTAAEERMAELPRGARLLRGRQQLAFAFRAGNVLAFPGVPDLLQDVFESAAEQLRCDPFCKETIWVRGKEGDFSETLAAVQARHPGVGIGSYPVFLDGRYRCKLVLRAREPEALAAAVSDVQAELALDHPPAGE